MIQRVGGHYAGAVKLAITHLRRLRFVLIFAQQWTHLLVALACQKIKAKKKK